MNALAIHLYLTIRYINLTFNYFGNFYRIIVILDEVLKGTNSEDKLCGTLELLEFFYERNYMAMIATHDMGVTSLESKYGEIKFKNYCFEIELNNPITYTYKIKRGICKNRNASHILSHMLSSKKWRPLY